MTNLKEKDKQKAFEKGGVVKQDNTARFTSCVIFFALRNYLFLLMPVLPQTLFAFVCRHLVSFPLFSVWHNIQY
jgi:hypothetical protein